MAKPQEFTRNILQLLPLIMDVSVQVYKGNQKQFIQDLGFISKTGGPALRQIRFYALRSFLKAQTSGVCYWRHPVNSVVVCASLQLQGDITWWVLLGNLILTYPVSQTDIQYLLQWKKENCTSFCQSVASVNLDLRLWFALSTKTHSNTYCNHWDSWLLRSLFT